MRLVLFFIAFLIFYDSPCQKTKIQLPSLTSGELEYLHSMPPIDKKDQRKKEVKGRFIDVKLNPNEVIQLFIKSVNVSASYLDSSKKIKTKRVLSKLIWNNSRFRLIDKVELNNRVFLVSSGINHILKRHYIVAFELDLETFKINSNSPVVLIDEDDDENTMFSDQLVSNGNVHNKLVIFSKKVTRNKGVETFLHVFDADLKNKLSGKLMFPNEDMVKLVNSIYFENENSIAVTAYCSSYSKLFWQKNGRPNYSHKLYYFTNRLENVIGFGMGLTECFPTEYIPVINDKNEIVVAGFYTKTNFLYMHGLFYMKVDLASRTVVKNSFEDINRETAVSLLDAKSNKIAASKEQRTGRYSMHEFNLKQLFFTEDGKIKLIAEDIRSESTARLIYPVFIPTTNYNYKDLLVFELNTEGKLVWATKIKKQAKSKRISRDQFVTFISQGGKCNFIFNYNLRNLKNIGKTKSNGRRNSAPVLVLVDENGKQTLEILKEPKSGKSIVFYPDSFSEIEYSEKEFSTEFYLKLRDQKGIGYYKFKSKL